ncbi:hypothetical protein BH789_gp038 [Gordonia phage GMA6]|uniref:Uncharacterized protein n=1 Tax=Gordonia phage GMA6 TaxID=1647285 RepID=A0A0K0NL49_9CAUD|nr:hypothetical protein BH789_gp038 [Gordonia phage GMA6]AKL88319.1 hypothetical protein GMA6_38 [Gordonia phage GMA6]
MAGAFYGGGHSTKSALDVAFWCQQNVATYYSEGDVFVPPSAPVVDMTLAYQSLAYAVEQAGAFIPTDYFDLMALLQSTNSIVAPDVAASTRGALLINKGVVCLSLGDRRRIIVEENYRLAQKYMDPGIDFLTTFENGALIPGVAYL